VDPESPNPAPRIEPPRGFYSGRVDEKGRLKLPARFQEYLGGLPDKTFFITTLGDGIARIYPISVWKENEAILENFTEDPEAAQRLAFLANAYGSDSEIDGQGRVMLSQELRRKLELENQGVQLMFYRGRIDVYRHTAYEAQLAEAAASSQKDRAALGKAGVK
jgi:MraZ protein